MTIHTRTQILITKNRLRVTKTFLVKKGYDRARRHTRAVGCLVARTDAMATAQATKNNITLKGSTAIVTEFFGYAVMMWGQLLWSLRKLRARGPEPPPGPDPGLRVKAAVASGVLAALTAASVLGDGCIFFPCQSGRR